MIGFDWSVLSCIGVVTATRGTVCIGSPRILGDSGGWKIIKNEDKYILWKCYVNIISKIKDIMKCICKLPRVPNRLKNM